MAYALLAPAAEECGAGGCDCASSIALGDEAFCVDHFLLRCYEKLADVEPRGRKFSPGVADVGAMREFIEECSLRALEVSLHPERLSNLQRARVLDILIWAGELYICLRQPRMTLAESTAPADSGARRIGIHNDWGSGIVSH